FPDLLRLIDERSTAFCAVVASAPSLDVQVPTCPEWTLLDLVQHLGEGRRRWAAIVAAGPADAAPDRSAWEGAPAVPREREALLRNDDRLAARAGCRRLPRHRGPLVAPLALRRRRTDRPPVRARYIARHRCRRGPGRGRRLRRGYGR